MCLKAARICLTFQMMTLEKYLTKNFDIFFRGYPLLAPQSAASPKMTTPALPMTPLFYYRILFHTKNVDVCKKLELNPLRFDRDIRVLSSMKYNLKIFNFFALWTKNAVNQRIFKNFLIHFSSTWSTITPLFYNYLDQKPQVTKG